jgi:probable phosphoglycerate mutase
MKLIAVRHGETEWNRAQREMGQMNSPLTALGIQQAQAIARRLSQVSFAALYSSDLGRAMQTAEMISEASHMPVTVDVGLRERALGIFEGLTVDEMRQKYPRERADFERHDPDYAMPGGESARQRLERGSRALTAIAERHPGQTVVAVTHGGVMTGFFEFVVGMGPGDGETFYRGNCSYNSFEYADGKWHLETWNDTTHLAGLEATHFSL